MKRKRILTTARRVLAVNSETVIESELLKFKAPIWLRLWGYIDQAPLIAWYHAEERRTVAKVQAAARGIYRRAKK